MRTLRFAYRDISGRPSLYCQTRYSVCSIYDGLVLPYVHARSRDTKHASRCKVSSRHHDALNFLRKGMLRQFAAYCGDKIARCNLHTATRLSFAMYKPVPPWCGISVLSKCGVVQPRSTKDSAKERAPFLLVDLL